MYKRQLLQGGLISVCVIAAFYIGLNTQGAAVASTMAFATLDVYKRQVVVDILDRLLPEGLITYMENKQGQRIQEIKSDAEHFVDLPMAVLVNGSSASASEVFTGALKDYGMAEVVGTKTYGKGIVQTIFPLGDGSAIKMTTSRYFTPNGVCIHGTGIEPDVTVELDESLQGKEKISHEEDNQLQKALERCV